MKPGVLTYWNPLALVFIGPEVFKLHQLVSVSTGEKRPKKLNTCGIIPMASIQAEAHLINYFTLPIFLDNGLPLEGVWKC